MAVAHPLGARGVRPETDQAPGGTGGAGPPGRAAPGGGAAVAAGRVGPRRRRGGRQHPGPFRLARQVRPGGRECMMTQYIHPSRF